LALKSLAVRHQQLTAEVEALETQLELLVAQAAPDLVAVTCQAIPPPMFKEFPIAG
jgi:hypothetical protein